MAQEFKLFGGTIHSALVHAATAYDRRREGKPGHNIYALAQYLARIEQVESDIGAGAPVRAAILAAFSDRLLDAMLTAVGEPKFKPGEPKHGWAYQPVAARD